MMTSTPVVLVATFTLTAWCILAPTGKGWGSSILCTLLLAAVIVVLVEARFALPDQAGVIDAIGTTQLCQARRAQAGRYGLPTPAGSSRGG